MKSNCCKAKMVERGDTHRGGTFWFECTKCQRPCDPLMEKKDSKKLDKP